MLGSLAKHLDEMGAEECLLFTAAMDPPRRKDTVMFRKVFLPDPMIIQIRPDMLRTFQVAILYQITAKLPAA